MSAKVLVFLRDKDGRELATEARLQARNSTEQNFRMTEVNYVFAAVCDRPVITISPEQTISEACMLSQDKNVGCLVVAENGAFYGILTDRDIARKVTGVDKNARQPKVRDVMTANPARISVKKNLSNLISLSKRPMPTRRPKSRSWCVLLIVPQQRRGWRLQGIAL
jgi:signal-transduction protein with cAMP-binding, CBS, and nucleotidyltransferase domain